MEGKLEPCPFCGGEVSIILCDDEGNLHDEAYRECASWFYDKTMEGLRRLIPDGGTEDDVRIVFEFDC